MINQKCLIDDIKKITIKIVGARGVGRTYFSSALEEYKKLVIEVIEKQPKFYIPDKNKPLSFEEIGNCKWVWDNKDKEYIQLDGYDKFDEVYGFWCTSDPGYLKRIYKYDFENTRFYRWEVIE